MRVTRHMVLGVALALAAVALVPAQARAQGIIVQGGQPAFQPRLYVGLGIGYDYILNDSTYLAHEGEVVGGDTARVHLTHSGFDWTLYVGARFNPWVAAEIAWDALYTPSAEEGEYNYAMIDGARAAVRLYFPTGYNIEPVIRVGAGVYFYGDEFTADEVGFGYSAAVGASWELASWIDIELFAQYRAWYFDGIEAPTEGTYRCGGGYCPFGDQYVHAINFALQVHWNTWMWVW